MRRILKFLFGRDLWASRFGVLAATSFLSLIWFVTDWCMYTTFRAMSDWLLWAVNIAAAFLLMLPFVLTRRVWVQGVWLAILDAFMISNIMYCRTYFTAIPADNYALAGNLGDFVASVVDSIRWPDAVFTVILAAGWILAVRTPRRNIKRLLGRYVSLLGLAVAIAAGGMLSRGSFFSQYDKLVQSCYYSTCGVPTYTLAGHLAYSIHAEGRPSEAMQREAAEWLRMHDDNVSSIPSHLLTDSIRKNLVVIILESFESWPIGTSVGGVEITPYLDSLVSLPTTFYAPHMLTQVASGRSIDCQLLLNAGLLPPLGSVYSMKYPHSTYPTINKALREKYGTRSIIFTADKPITWNQAAIARAFGYDSLIDRRAWKMDEMIGNPAKLSDGSFMRQAVSRIKDASSGLWPEGKSAMLTFVTYSGHNPFIIPDKFNDRALSSKLTGMPKGIKHYIEAAHYTDSQLHILIDYLKSRPDYDKTIVVITGDHEGLASLRRDAMHSSKASRLVSKEQFTPFIVLNAPVGGRYDEVFGQIDMYPTLLDMLGLNDYHWRGLGHSLLRVGAPRCAVSSMTGEVAGDTTGVDMNVLRKARRISDVLIRADMLKNQPLDK